ncbi:MAG: glycosyltransferase family 4 protein [Desulfuromonadaceae bacterium]
MKILHILSQIPAATGSGFYLQATMQQAHLHEHQNYLLAGVTKNFPFEQHCAHLPCADPELIRFEHDIDLPIVGMSDVMPYPSARFCDLSNTDLLSYETCFSARLRHAVKRWNPDIIHSHHLWLLTSLARQKFPALPLVASCHGSDLRQFHNCAHLRDAVLCGCSKVNAVCALSAEQKEQIVRTYHIAPEHIHVVGAGYNKKLFCAPETPSESNQCINIVYAGKLSRAKGVPWLIRSLMKIRHKNWHLHLAGDGDGAEKVEIINLAGHIGDNVTIHGNMDQTHLAQLLKSAQLFVLPSFYEGVPLVVLEALACHCRVITTDLPGISEIFQDLDNSEWLTRVPLPRMSGIDTPHPKAEDDFVASLNDAIELQLEHLDQNLFSAKPPAEITGILNYYNWCNTFKRIEKVYKEILPV